MLKNNSNIILTLVVVFIISFLDLNAQNRIHSPYSRFGIGELQSFNNSRYTAMGGIGYAVRNPTSVNILNPASYTSFDSLSFVFEGGLFSNFTKLETSSLSQKSNYTSLGYITFGFPINNWWKGSFGLLPYSSVGYNVSESQDILYLGKVKNKFEGTGGLNQFYIGQAFKINQNLSLGVNVSYLFGFIDRIQAVYFPDSLYTYNIKDAKSTNIGIFNFNFGLQYTKKVGNGLTMGCGIVFSNAMNAKTTEDQLVYSFSESTSGYEYVHDTSTNYSQNDIAGNIHIPMNFGIGFSLEKTNKWLVGADLNWQNWANYTYNDVKDASLTNSMRISVGGEIKPDYYSTKYFKRITYRAGFKYTTTNLKINNTQIDEFGISFGLGLPLRKSKSTFNFGIEYGKRGSLDNDLIKENFTKITIGFSAYDFWFFKRKFD
jgi:hypothetical protein